MKLSPEDLFTLFNSASKGVGAGGYTGTFAQQGATTKAAWTQFHALIKAYMPPEMAASPADAKRAAEYTTDETVRRIIDPLNSATQKRLYEVLHYLGNRINR